MGTRGLQSAFYLAILDVLGGGSYAVFEDLAKVCKLGSDLGLVGFCFCRVELLFRELTLDLMDLLIVIGLQRTHILLQLLLDISTA